MNAPEQLWPRAYTQAEADGPSYSGAVKYVRADIHAAVVAERDALRAALENIATSDPQGRWPTEWELIARAALSQPMPEEK